MNTIYRPTNFISWQSYGNTVYIIDERKETVSMLENAGAYFWNKVLELKSVSLVIEDMLTVFKVNISVLQKDMEKILYDLVNLGYLEAYNGN